MAQPKYKNYPAKKLIEEIKFKNREREGNPGGRNEVCVIGMKYLSNIEPYRERSERLFLFLTVLQSHSGLWN